MNENNTYQDNNQIPTIKQKRFTQNTKTLTIIVIVSIACALIFPQIIVGYRIGLNFFLCALCLITSLVYTIVDNDNYRLSPLIFWSVMLIIYTSVFFRLRNTTYLVFSFLFTPLMFTFLIFFTTKDKAQKQFSFLAETFFSQLVHGFKLFPAIFSIRKLSKKSKVFVEILLGIIISLMLFVIIVPLMFSADIQFGNYIKDWIDKTFDSFFALFGLKCILASFLAMVYFGYLFMASKKTENTQIKTSDKQTDISTNILLTVISMVTLLYTTFTISTLLNAITHNANKLPIGMTYTEYARSGFFQLAWLTAINFLMLLIVQYFMRNKDHRAKIISKIIFAIQIIINFCLLGLSAYKMTLYTYAYGLTLLRILVYIILAYELILLGLISYKVYNENFKFITVAIYFSFAFWSVISFINVEKIIVNYNAANIPLDRFDFSNVCYNLSKDASGALKDYVIKNYDDIQQNDMNEINEYYKTDMDIEDLNDLAWYEYNISDFKYLKDRDEFIEFINAK